MPRCTGLVGGQRTLLAPANKHKRKSFYACKLYRKMLKFHWTGKGRQREAGEIQNRRKLPFWACREVLESGCLFPFSFVQLDFWFHSLEDMPNIWKFVHFLFHAFLQYTLERSSSNTLIYMCSVLFKTLKYFFFFSY